MLSNVARKTDWQTVTFRLAPDLGVFLDAFAEEHPEWSKAEVIQVALHWFSQADEKTRLEALMKFRARRGTEPPAVPPAAPRSPRPRGNSGT